MSEGKSEREQRLAQALRANLRRRKGQARALTPDAPGEAGESMPDQPPVPDSGETD